MNRTLFVRLAIGLCTVGLHSQLQAQLTNAQLEVNLGPLSIGYYDGVHTNTFDGGGQIIQDFAPAHSALTD